MNRPIMLWKWIAAIAALTVVPAAISQTLVARSSLPAPNAGSSFVMPLHCDSHGNIFVRSPSAGVTRGSRPRPSLTKVGPDGKRAATFDLSAAAADGLGDLVLKVFAVDPGGAL